MLSRPSTRPAPGSTSVSCPSRASKCSVPSIAASFRPIGEPGHAACNRAWPLPRASWPPKPKPSRKAPKSSLASCMSTRDRAAAPRPLHSPLASSFCFAERDWNCTSFSVPGACWVRTIALPSFASPMRRSSKARLSGGTLPGSMSSLGAAAFAGAAPMPPRHQNFCSLPTIAAPSSRGIDSVPARSSPSNWIAVAPPAAGEACTRVSRKSAPSSCMCAALTSMRCNGKPPCPLSPARDSTAQSSASSVGARPVATSPFAGGASATRSAPSATRTPVPALPLLARKASRLPNASATSPSPSGSCASMRVASGVFASLSSGAGKVMRVPTRFERNCRLLGAFADCASGKATPIVHCERPSK